MSPANAPDDASALRLKELGPPCMNLADSRQRPAAIIGRHKQHTWTGTLLLFFAPMWAGSLSCSLYMGGGAACACRACGCTASGDLLRRCWGCLATCLVKVFRKLAAPMLLPARRLLPADKAAHLGMGLLTLEPWRSIKDLCTHCDHICMSGVSLPETAASGCSWRGAIGDHWMDGWMARDVTTAEGEQTCIPRTCCDGSDVGEETKLHPSPAGHPIMLSSTTTKTLHSLHHLWRCLCPSKSSSLPSRHNGSSTWVSAYMSQNSRLPVERRFDVAVA